ncbi:NADP-dependent oxidoreductase domain containing protein [Desulfovibrio sp. X2]|uniref:aldo/keto reductase n=1 Tax=Desulfovibrio sp. X2 TaxID=941449 RepID=UPI000358D399|nr:aldo/keto reductase [Desulfovibrio sp. X2]EPR42660.1 NADP-dependent oxidoreductase domain containing protein [Desulfovibrio sp. X2]
MPDAPEQHPGQSANQPSASAPAALPDAFFGSTGRSVSRLGLGGEGILRTFGEEAGAEAVIDTALAEGVTYFDTAPAYSGSEGYLGRAWARHPGARERVFQTSKSARREQDGAREDLENSLRTLGTDHLDLWQIHDVRTAEDIARIEGPGGALTAFTDAKARGLVRHIGVTGHHDPDVLLHCVTHWPLDSVLLPVNVAEGALPGFLDRVVPAARARGMAVVGMKVFGGGHYIFPQGHVTPELLLRFALSQDVDLVLAGCGMPDHVRIAAKVAREFRPMPPAAQEELLEAFRPHAAQLAFYRGTTA